MDRVQPKWVMVDNHAPIETMEASMKKVAAYMNLDERQKIALNFLKTASMQEFTSVVHNPMWWVNPISSVRADAMIAEKNKLAKSLARKESRQKIFKRVREMIPGRKATTSNVRNVVRSGASKLKLENILRGKKGLLINLIKKNPLTASAVGLVGGMLLSRGLSNRR